MRILGFPPASSTAHSVTAMNSDVAGAVSDDEIWKRVAPSPLPRSKSTGDLDCDQQAHSATTFRQPLPEVPAPALESEDEEEETQQAANGTAQAKARRRQGKGARRRARQHRLGRENGAVLPTGLQAMPSVTDVTTQFYVELSHAKTAPCALPIINSHLDNLDFAMSVAAMHSVAKLSDALQEVELVCLTTAAAFRQLAARIERLLPAPASLLKGSITATQLTDAMYSLGKLEAVGLHSLIKALCQALSQLIDRATRLEMSTTLWALAKLVPAESASSCASAPARELALALLIQITRSPNLLTPHCISNAMWARVRLDLQGRAVQEFVDAFKHEVVRRGSLEDFAPQGLANTAWAIAKSVYKHAAPRDWAAGQASLCIIRASRHQLAGFETVELSMSAWAVTRIHARNEGGLEPGAIQEVMSFVIAIAEDSVRRFKEMSGQSISNIAWALSKLDVDCKGNPGVHTWFSCAMQAVVQKPFEFSPQAVANLAYGVSWLNSRVKARLPTYFREEMERFGEAAASQALERESEFNWQDLSGVLVSIGPRHEMDSSPLSQGPCTKALAEHLAWLVAAEGHKLTTQVGLNIAVAAIRVGISASVSTALFQKMATVMAQASPNLNNHDLRQFRELFKIHGQNKAKHEKQAAKEQAAKEQAACEYQQALVMHGASHLCYEHPWDTYRRAQEALFVQVMSYQ